MGRTGRPQPKGRKMDLEQALKRVAKEEQMWARMAEKASTAKQEAELKRKPVQDMDTLELAVAINKGIVK